MKRIFFSMLLSLAFLGNAFAATIDFNNPDLSAWYTDRKAPAVFETAMFDGDNRLRIGINGADAGADSFYNYQGKKIDVNADIFKLGVTADLYVDSSWGDANVGIWATTFDSLNAVAGYPIVAWRSSASVAAGFYAFDYYNGGWITLGTGYSEDAWHNITMRYSGGSMDYYVDDVLLYAFADPWQDGTFGNIILNSYNFGQSFDVYWDNVGTVPTPEPATLLLTGASLAGLWGARRRKAA